MCSSLISDEDEWFFNSVKRYNELQMFDFPKIVQEIDLSSLDNVCVAFEADNNHRNEVLKLELPSILKPKNKISKFDRHLSFTHGHFTESPLIQMKCLLDKENIIISEANGIGLYNINPKESDCIDKIVNLPCNIKNAKISVNGCYNYVAVSNSTEKEKVIIDYESVKIVTTIYEENNKNSDIIPLFCAKDVVSFGNNYSGHVSLYDVRSAKFIDSIIIPNTIEYSKSYMSQWIFNTAFESSRNICNSVDLFYLFSTSGNYLIFDLRNLKEAIHYSKHPLDCESLIRSRWKVKVNFSPTNLNKFSVCGYDENVYICELRNNTVELLFTHNGHPYSNDEFESGIVTTCSNWIPCLSDAVISCASNESVHCWQYLN